jgi:hypothetical protein
MRVNRIFRVVAGTAALVVGLAVAGWAISTLWTYWRFVTGLGSLTSRFAWRSLTFGVVEIVIAAALVCVAARCFGPKPLWNRAPAPVLAD